MRYICVLFYSLYMFVANAQSTINTTNSQTFVGIYRYTTPPGFPFPGTDTITLSSNGVFRYDMSLSGGKMAAFLGTWTSSNDKVIAITNERLLDGKPYPSTNINEWKPGNTMILYVIGDKLYKSKDSNEAFIKLSKEAACP